MSKTNKNIKKYLGYKFYKQKEDESIHLVRLIKIHEFNDKITIKDEDTKETKEISFTDLTGYTPITPYGKISFAQVKMFSNRDDKRDGFVKDVIVAAYRDIDMKMEQYEPFAVARQNITDFWYNLLTNDPNHEMVGASVTRENCPPNIPYAIMMGCDEPILYEMVSLYMDDTIETLLECIDIKSYDEIFKKLFDDHMTHLNPLYDRTIPTKFDSKNGWCKNLSTFLKENNFITDIDNMRNITAVDFSMLEFMNKVEEMDIYHFTPEFLQFFNNTFSINAVSADAIEYGLDVDISEFNNHNYILMRDNTNKLFIVVYTLSGEHFETDLEKESNKLSISDKLRLDFFNKYAGNEN